MHRKTVFSFLFVLLSVVLGAAVRAAEHRDLIGWWVVDGEFVKGIVAEMEKEAAEKDKQMLKMFVPFIGKMMARQTAIFTETEFVASQMGGGERRMPYTVKSIDGDTLTLDLKGREMEFVLKDGRLVNKRELGGKRPPMYMRKLTEAEITERKAAIEAASRPPPATETPDKRLSFLVHRATPAQIDQLLADEKDLLTIRQTRFRKATAVHLAAESGKVELLRKLLAAGADATVADAQKRTPLFACVEGFKPPREAFDLLVAAGVSVTDVNDNDETVLMAYCGRGKDTAFLKHLLTLGLDMDHTSKWRRTALSTALEHGWMEGARVLIDAGADVAGASGALSRVVRKADLPAIRLLVTSGVKADGNGETALMHALESDDEAVKKILPQVLDLCKNDLELRDSQGKTALFRARDAASAKLLVATGADTAAKSKSGDSLLHAAADSVELLTYYIGECGLAIDCENERKQTPLQYAAGRKDNLSAIKYLVGKGADVSHGDTSGSGPLSWALAEKGDERLGYVKYLLANGADPNSPTPLECTKAAVFQGSEEALRLLVKSGMSLKTDPKQHYTPFWYAIFAKKPAMVKLLIELGADPTTKNAAGKTALDIATEFKNTEIIELLSK